MSALPLLLTEPLNEHHSFHLAIPFRIPPTLSEHHSPRDDTLRVHPTVPFLGCTVLSERLPAALRMHCTLHAIGTNTLSECIPSECIPLNVVLHSENALHSSGYRDEDTHRVHLTVSLSGSIALSERIPPCSRIPTSTLSISIKLHSQSAADYFPTRLDKHPTCIMYSIIVTLSERHPSVS
jgi:hypothetical protein